MTNLEQTQKDIYDIVTSKNYTYHQKVLSLAKKAESITDFLHLSPNIKNLINERLICDLFEGELPYRPRYIVPDYDKLMKDGCKFLELNPPKDIWEATNTLLIFYKNVPSITGFPIYIGNLDKLLAPFVVDEDEAYRAIKLFLIHIDRTITDSFCHGNIGPEASRAGELILEASKETQTAIPNITLKYDPEITCSDFAEKAVSAGLKVAKPSFANHKMFKSELGDDYAIVSCYNGLKISGGSYTLTRLLLGNIARKAKTVEEFFDTLFPQMLNEITTYMDERIRFIAEESNFFESNFLAQEGFIKKENFTAMLGLVGLHECVEELMKKQGLSYQYGKDSEADELGLKIMEMIENHRKNHKNKYCLNNSFVLHAQVGIDTDIGESPGVRIKIGKEPEHIEDQLIHSAKYHKYFPSGCGDIYPFDETASRNPAYILDIIKGAFKKGVRYFSLYEDNADVIRITGYLVKRSEMEKFERGEASLNGATVLGVGAKNNGKILERKVRQ